MNAKTATGRWGCRIGKGLLNSLALLFGAVTVSFFLFSVAPGDPARVMLGANAPEDQVQALRNQLGLNRPLAQQYLRHMTHVLSLDLGTSLSNGRRVSAEVGEKFLITATIGVQAAIFSLVASYALNFLFFLKPRMAFVLPILRFGVLLPVFLITILGALLFGIAFPSVSLSSGSSAAGPFRQLFPSAIAALYPLAVMTTVLRDRTSQGMAGPAFRAARAAGFHGWRLFHDSAFRPAAASWLSAWINQLSLVFFASLVLEVILSIPGSGNLLLNAIQQRDYPILQGILLVNACFFICVTWFGDVLYSSLDPRT